MYENVEIMTVHRNEKYNGEVVHNKKIISLQRRLVVAKDKVEQLESAIEDFQKDCNHDYYMTSTGMYDDAYECIHCGKTEWF